MANEELKQQELNIYNRWQKHQRKEDFQDLYSSMEGMISKAARTASYGSNLPESAHKAWAAQNFLDALKTYKPNSGAALQTHVWNSVRQKSKRLNYLYQNLGHSPEPRIMKVGLYQTEFENMKEELGREPTTAELADRLSMGIRDIARMQKEIRKDLSMSGGLEEVGVFETPVEEETLDFMYYDLGPEEKLVFEYITGKYGKQKMVKSTGKIDFDGIASRTGFSSSKVRAIHGKIKTKLKKALEK